MGGAFGVVWLVFLVFGVVLGGAEITTSRIPIFFIRVYFSFSSDDGGILENVGAQNWRETLFVGDGGGRFVLVAGGVGL